MAEKRVQIRDSKYGASGTPTLQSQYQFTDISEVGTAGTTSNAITSRGYSLSKAIIG